MTLQFKDIELSDKPVEILAVLKPQLYRNYSSETPTKIILQAAVQHLQVPPETPKPYPAPCLEYHRIQTIFRQVHGVWKKCSWNSVLIDVVLHLLSLMLERQRGTQDMGLEECLRNDCQKCCRVQLYQYCHKIKVFHLIYVSLSVHSSETTSTACLSSHLWFIHQFGTTKWQICRTLIL